MTAKKKTSARRVSSPVIKSRTKTVNPKTLAKNTRSKVTSSSRRPSPGLFQVVARYGVLRALLAVAGLLLVVFATQPGTIPVYAGWPLVVTVLVPVLSPIIFMLLLLDALMSRVWMIDKQGDEYLRLRTAVMINLLLAAGLLLFWAPYYLALR